MSRKNLVKGWRLKGQALLAQGQGEQAEAALARALTIGREIGNPPQLWKTYQALGAWYESQADRERAQAAYQSAIDVIDGVAERLQDQELKGTFLTARHRCKRSGNTSPKPVEGDLEMRRARTVQMVAWLDPAL